MGEFRRTRSKVWWSNYFQDDEEADDRPPSLARSVARFSWRRSVAIDDNNSNRNSSSSPSSGSQKSQDSGFSDSESSSPSSCGSSSDTKNSSTEPQTTILKHNDDSNAAEASTVEQPLPETPVNRIPRPTLIRHRRKEVKSADSISHYLADCYFPVPTAAAVATTPTAASSIQLPSTPNAAESTIQTTPATPYNWRHRTCFIVDELPKKRAEDTSFQSHDSQVSNSSPETSSSPSLSSLEEYKVDDTVRFVEEKKDCVEMQRENVEASPQSTPPPLPTVPPPPPCINVDLLKKECRLSNLDLSHLPEPTHTSTPKKDDKSSVRGYSQKNKTATIVEEPESKTSIDPIDPPVVRWLNELKYRYEPECMITLQAKLVTHCCRRTPTITISESSTSAQIFQQKTKTIANEFLKLYDILHDCRHDQLESHLKTLINYIMEFIINYSQLLPRMELSDKDNLLKLMDMCDRLRQIEYPYGFDQRSLLNNVTILEKFFSRFVDSVLTQHIVLLTAVLKTPNSEATLLHAMSGLATLSSNSSQTCELITYFDGVENLLAICLNTHSTAVCKAALRTLTAVCQNATSIRRLENARGIEILSLLLSDMNRIEAELLEVISVLVQITAPWIEDDHIIKGLIYHLRPILDALTRLICTTSSCETLLLSAAALANISFIEPQAVFMLIELNTVNCLLTAVRKLGARASIFLQEQVATLVANMAAMPESRSHLAQHRAVGALLCFLQVKHSPLQTAVEITAAQRLQHKSAIALSRLCTNTEISKQVVELQGVNQLVRLCKEERERNFNDDILVACLASLRKITANCGNESINQLNAKELVEPRLVDSFLLYSSRQESYV